MAKRKADSMLAVFAPPFKRFLCEQRSTLPCIARPPAKRKMELAEAPRSGEGPRPPQRPRAALPVSPPARSRSADGGVKRARADGEGPSEREPDPGAEGESRRRGSTELRRRNLCGSQDQPDGDECWQYNSFHYWRVPLPNIDFSDILQLDVDNVTEELESTSAEGGDMEMES